MLEFMSGLRVMPVFCRRLALLLLLLGLNGCHKKSPTELLSEAEQMFRDGDILSAQMKYQEIVDKYADAPESNQARLGLAMSYGADRNFEEARKHLVTAIEKAGGAGSPEGFKAASMLISSYVNEEKPDLALSEALKTSATLRDAPQEAREVWSLQMLDLFRMNKRDDEATSLGWALLAIPPSDMQRHMPVLERLGQIYAARQKPDKAASAYDRYLALYPETPLRGMVLFGKAFYLKSAGDDAATTKALDETEAQFQKDFEKALGADQKVQALLQIARVIDFRGLHDEARKTVEQLLDRDAYPLPQHRQAGQMALVQLEMARKRPAAAIAVLEEVVKENPNTDVAANAQMMMQGIQQHTSQTTRTAASATTATLGTVEPTSAADAVTTAP